MAAWITILRRTAENMVYYKLRLFKIQKQHCQNTQPKSLFLQI